MSNKNRLSTSKRKAVIAAFVEGVSTNRYDPHDRCVHSTIGTSPAVASGITDRVWAIEHLIGLLP